ncbi:hypothetical protein VTK56DRAFT_1908 [Thermocarpiscus australiensis]
MVHWFERSSGTPNGQVFNRLRVHSDTSDNVGHRDGKADGQSGHDSDNGENRTTKTTNSPLKAQAQHGKPGCRVFTAPPALPSASVCLPVEDYSLTLLKHKSYFNNRPLARCLDDYHKEEEEDKASEQVRTDKKNSNNSANRNQKNKEDEQEGRNMATLPYKKKDTLSPIQRLDDLMKELLTWQQASGPETLTTYSEQERRNPAKVEAFWGCVRAKLWIDDAEIYGAKLEPTAESESQNGFEGVNESHHWTSSTSFDSDPDSVLPPPPMPTRMPPPVPTVPQRRDSSRRNQHSAVLSLEPFPDPESDYPAWDQPPPPSSVRMSISFPGYLDTLASLLPDKTSRRELPEPPVSPVRQAEGRLRPPVRAKEGSHSRYPSSSGSAWRRPPTWRSLSSTAPSHDYTHHHQRSTQHRSKPSTSTSTNSATTLFSNSSGRRHKASTGSTASASTPVGSGSFSKPNSTCDAILSSIKAAGSTDLSQATTPPIPPLLRRLTAEEKLSEIDAFLSSAGEEEEERDDSGRVGWI